MSAPASPTPPSTLARGLWFMVGAAAAFSLMSALVKLASRTVPTAEITDDKLHRFGVHVDDGKGHAPEVRFLLFKKPDGNIVAVGDVCTICGPVGFYMSPQGITCKMCASPLVPASMGQPGGCNPIPLKSTNLNGQITIAADDLKALAPRFVK